MNLKNLTRYIDIAFCIFLLPAMMMLLPLDKWMEHRLDFLVLLIIWLYSLYLLHRRVTIPLLFGTKRHRFIALVIFICATLITLCIAKYQNLPEIFFAEGEERLTSKMNLQQQAVWFLYVMVSAFSMAVSLLTILAQQISQNQSIEFEKKRAELALYKAQINPHFLFNTLNALYGLIITKSEKAEEAFVLFTSLMKYIYTNGTADEIELKSELEYITQYIELQRLRIPTQSSINYRTELSDEPLTIAPMLLITFVENAIKYGVSSQRESVINISISVTNKELHLTTHNQTMVHNSEDKRGIGIENCRQRLELLYPNRYELQIDEKQAEYRMSLKLKLTTKNG